MRGDFGAFVEKLAAAERKSELIESFLAEHPTLPIHEGPTPEGTLVHFVYHGKVDDLAISGNFIREGGEQVMAPGRRYGTSTFGVTRCPRTQSFPTDIRSSRLGFPIRPTPRRTGPDGRESSVLATAGWQAPFHLREPEGERGRFETLVWKSERLGNEREVQIYLPPGYGDGE